MRISYKTHPALNRLYTASRGISTMHLNSELIENLNEDEKSFWLVSSLNWHIDSKKYIEDINVVSEPFFKNIAALSSAFNNVVTSFMDEDGTDIFTTFIIYGLTITLSWQYLNGSLEYLYTAFSRDDNMVICGMCGTQAGKPIVNQWVSPEYKKRLRGEGLSDVQFIAREIGNIMSLYVFKKYADVETKLLPAGQKVKGIDCEYGKAFNETGLDITYLTSTWFTNLVKSDAFKVRGHFRFQACGQGMKDRKIVWINDFEKEGYHRRADKLLQAS